MHSNVVIYKIQENLDGWKPDEIYGAFSSNLLYSQSVLEVNNSSFLVNWIKDYTWILDEGKCTGTAYLCYANIERLYKDLQTSDQVKEPERSRLSIQVHNVLASQDWDYDYIAIWYQEND